jgi:hypothetical protein
MAPWADEEYSNARAQVFVAALELHKALIAAQAEVFEANLAALMELVSAGPAGIDAEVLLAAWRSFFLVVPVVRVPAEAAGSLFDGLRPGALGWLLAAGQPATDDWPGPARCFDRAVFAGDRVQAEDSRYGTWLPAGPPDTAGSSRDTRSSTDTVPPKDTVPPTDTGPPKDTGPRWVGMPLRVVRGQDRTTVDERNDLDYDGLLIAGRD